MPQLIEDGFFFNPYRLNEEQPLPFHRGLQKLFPQVQDAIARLMRSFSVITRSRGNRSAAPGADRALLCAAKLRRHRRTGPRSR